MTKLSPPCMHRPVLLAGIIAMVLGLGACSDSNTEAETTNTETEATNTPPIAVAGVDQGTKINSTVNLDSSASSDADNDNLSYFWTLKSKPEGSNTAINSMPGAQITFTPDVAGIYIFSLTVTDGTSTDNDEILITASADPVNTAPIANAGTDKGVSTGTIVSLDASGSSDVNGDSLSYTWLIMALPNSSTAVLSSALIANPNFMPDIAGAYTFQVTVSDGTTTSSDQVTITATGVNNADTPIDIYDAIFTNRNADCADYANTYDANVVDIKNSINFNSDVLVEATETECTITSNTVPNHDFNDETARYAGGADGATISVIDAASTITRTPAIAASPTPLSQEIKNAIFLNGVRLDIITAGCYRPGSPDALDDGNVGRGCRSDDPWVLDALGFEGSFGVDIHNGHTQPGGRYHYHGSPNAMFDDNPGSEGSPVIGFAADGFPIFGSYFHDTQTGQVRKALSGYSLKTGSRGTRSDTNPGGEYDGTYNDDWEFTGLGDLDECNGMTVGGQYGYYVTDTYPWVIKCFSGTPHESFSIDAP